MLTVVMTTYNPPGSPRHEYAVIAHSTWVKFAKGPSLDYLLADDGSRDTTLLKFKGLSYVTGPNVGIGGSLNRALAQVKGNWIYTTDDWCLTDYLDLTQAQMLLEMGYDMVRLGPIHPNLLCQTRFEVEVGWWLDICPYEGFAFATRPFLASPRLVEKVGPFKEGCNAYDCEQDYALRVAALRSTVRIAQTGVVTLEGPWKHIGEYEVGRLQPDSA